VGDSRALAETHLTLPRLRRGPSLSPLKGGEGNLKRWMGELPHVEPAPATLAQLFTEM